VSGCHPHYIYSFWEIDVLLTTLVWNRRDNFAEKPQIYQRVKSGRPFEILFDPNLVSSPHPKPLFYQDF